MQLENNGYPIHTGSFIPLRVGDKTARCGMDASHILETNRFDGYIRWLLHSPGITQDPVSYKMREERGHGIIASYWYVLSIIIIYYAPLQLHLCQHTLILMVGGQLSMCLL